MGPFANVGDTAYWTAMLRAVESEQPDAMVRDPFARRLAGDRGLEILDRAGGFAHNRSQMVRTATMDDMVVRLVTENLVNTVLDLGSGLDARPYRLPLPPSVRWVEGDFYELLAHKERILDAATPACQVVRVPCDLARDDDLIEIFRSQFDAGQPVLVLMEGVLRYLSQRRVEELSDLLRKESSIRYLLADVPGADQPKSPAADESFAPRSDAQRFFQEAGWQIDECRNLVDERRSRLGDVPEMPEIDAERARRASQYFLLTPDTTHQDRHQSR